MAKGMTEDLTSVERTARETGLPVAWYGCPRGTLCRGNLLRQDRVTSPRSVISSSGRVNFWRLRQNWTNTAT